MNRFLELAKTLAPILLPIINPKLAPLSPYISAGIAEAEALPGASGDAKRAHVENLVNIGATAVNQTAGHQVIDVGALGSAVSDGISTVVDTAKFLSNHPAVTTPPTPAATS